MKEITKSYQLLPGLALTYVKLTRPKFHMTFVLGHPEGSVWTYGIGVIYFFESDPEIRVKFSTKTYALEFRLWRFGLFIAFPCKDEHLKV